LNSTGVLFAEGTLFILVIGSFAFIDLDVAVGAVFYFGAVGFLIQFFLGKLMEKTGKTITKSVVETNTEISNLAEVVRESYILGIGDYFYNRIYNARLSASGNQATQFVLSGMPRYIVETALLVAISFFILIQALSGDLASSAATIAVFLSGGLRLTASLLPLQAALLNIKQSIPPAEKALALLFLGDSEDTEKPYSQITDVNRTPVSVTLRNLNFAYDKSDSYVLKNLSFEIPRGSQVAFIGASGAGKSTIADIILGILEPSSGEVLVDGVKPEELVRQSPGIFGYVPQSPAIISGTIAENIALGCQISEVDNEKLERVVSDSHLSALIQSLPMGVNTDMGNRKDELSGGQIQRIGLARALYRNPRLLILDEATSALDAESENEINGALNDLRGKVTVLMIAHRLNTIQRSDIVFLVQDGKITAQGKFSYLLQTNKTVKRLAKLMDIE
jgi:ATP-binding cassette subfamily C protein